MVLVTNVYRLHRKTSVLCNVRRFYANDNKPIYVGLNRRQAYHYLHVKRKNVLTNAKIFATASANRLFCNSTTTDNSTVNNENTNNNSTVAASTDRKKCSLVIFDKDGTLICFNSMWTPWARQIAQNIKERSTLSASAVHDALGYCEKQNKIKTGLLAEGTMGQIKEKLAQLLIHQGCSEEKANKIVVDAWFDCDTTHPEALKALDDLHGLFETLKENDVTIAVCTSDNRESTVAALTQLNLMQYVDKIVCGDDPDALPKPHPHNALKICKELGIHPEEAMMVGDTVVDVQMAKSARLGSSVGVLSGVGRAEDLLEKSDILLHKVGDLLPHILHRNKSNASTSKNGSVGLFARFKQRFFGSRKFSNLATQTAKRTFLAPVAVSQLASQKRDLNKLPPIGAKLTHIIVGAGSAGCVLANRLSENPDNRVYLIEAGPTDDWWKWKIHMPTALMYNLSNSSHNWYYHTLPEPHMNDRVMYCPRGRCWGGSSALNAMVYVRGHAKDYDRWVKEGAKGWSYAECLPYFRKSETFQMGADLYRGDSGPLHVTRFDGKSNPLYGASIEAGIQAGYGKTEDMNGYKQEGFGYMDATIHKGKRWSASQAYLWPILKRPNFFYENKALVTKLVIDKSRVVGVEVQTGHVSTSVSPGRNRIYTEKDVILAGGAINTPQILMLSGIGHEVVLKSVDIPVHLHLPGVGQNLQDHLELYVQHECTKPVTLYNKSTLRYPHRMAMVGVEWFLNRTGLGATNHLETGGFVRTDDNEEHPNIQYHFLPSMVVDHGRKDPDRHGFQFHVGPMRPTSRGFVKVTSRDPHEPVAIHFNYLSTELDRREMRDSVKITRQIFAQRAFDQFRGPELAPGVNVQTDSQIDAYVRANADSAYHPSCTCKMGAENDPDAVVDPATLKVKGMDNLRIVDASIMPSVVSGNLNGPVIMMAEKAADIIQAKQPLPPANVPVWSHKNQDK